MSRYKDLLNDPWLPAVLTGTLTLIPPRNYPRWLRRGVIWAPSVIATAGLTILAVNPKTRQKLTEPIPPADPSSATNAASDTESAPPVASPVQPKKPNTLVAAIAVAAATGATLSCGLAMSFWADEKIENGLRRLKVPFPRVVMGAVAGMVAWQQAKQDNRESGTGKHV